MTDFPEHACPLCGSSARIYVTFTGTCVLTPDGSEDCGDHEYTPESDATCASCNHTATLGDFIPEDDSDADPGGYIAEGRRDDEADARALALDPDLRALDGYGEA